MNGHYANFTCPFLSNDSWTSSLVKHRLLLSFVLCSEGPSMQDTGPVCEQLWEGEVDLVQCIVQYK